MEETAEYEKTNEYEIAISLIGDRWQLAPREYYLGDDGEWLEDEYQYRSYLNYTLAPEEAKHMDLPNCIGGEDFTMSDSSYIKSYYNPPQSVVEYLDTLPEYTVEPRD